MDIIDGREVPRRRIAEDETVSGTHQGGIVVMRGGHLRLQGTLQGSLHVSPGGAAEIIGIHQGSLHVAPSAQVQIRGSQHGSVHVDRDGFVEVSSGGKTQGSLHVDGRLTNRGIRAGSVHGNGVIEDVDGGYERLPDEILPDGTRIYRS